MKFKCHKKIFEMFFFDNAWSLRESRRFKLDHQNLFWLTFTVYTLSSISTEQHKSNSVISTFHSVFTGTKSNTVFFFMILIQFKYTVYEKVHQTLIVFLKGMQSSKRWRSDEKVQSCSGIRFLLILSAAALSTQCSFKRIIIQKFKNEL